MNLSFFGGAKIVTGSNYLLESAKKKILVDCGLFQGRPEIEKLNYDPFPYDPKEIDAVIITHAHIDHTGRLPKLVKDGFSGPIYATPATIDLTKLILADELKIQEDPFFSQKDLDNTFKLLKNAEYHQKTEISFLKNSVSESEKSKISFKLLDAGHILGSSIVEIFAEGKKIIFSGDLGNSPAPLLRPTEFPSSGDYILVESTYGDRTHPGLLKRKDLLEDTIEDVMGRGGALMIPAFALERTQELLYEFNELVENNRIPKVPVFVDSPLAIKSTEIYKKYEKYYNKEASFLIRSGDQVFDFPLLNFTRTVDESKKINDVSYPKVIIAGSGMSTGGRILHHERRYLSDPKNCLLVISFQVKGTLGRNLLNGAKEVNIFGDKISVKAEIKKIEGYSAHPDKERLFRWLYCIKNSSMIKGENTVKKVFAVQGEEKPSKSLAQLVKDHLGVDCEVPKYGQTFKL